MTKLLFTNAVTDKISLALVQPSFARDYLRIVSSQRRYLAKYLGWVNHSHDEQFFLDFINGSLHAYADGTAIRCAIVFKGRIVGNVSLESINHRLQIAKIGYWLDQDYQGKGIVTQAVQALIDMAFNELGLTKVEIRAATGNHPSRAVAERLGFQLEGIITQAECVDGNLMDHAVYALHLTNA